MKSGFLVDEAVSVHTPAMAPVCELLDTKEGPYVFLYNDAGGTHVVEDCEEVSQMQQLLTPALLVVGDSCSTDEERRRFAEWLQRFVEAYGPGGQ